MEPSGQAPELDFFDFEPPESLILVMPPEIVYSFAQPLDMSDLQSLSLACKWLHAALEKCIWHTLVVRPVVPNLVDSIPGAIPRGIPVRLVRHLHFRAADEMLEEARCIHWDPCPQTTGVSKFKIEPSLFSWPRLDELAANAQAIVHRIRRGQLMSFSWDMGVCLPPCVLRQLASTQSQISSLELTTDGRCWKWPEANIVYARRFYQLEAFGWTGPPDLAALADFLGPRVKAVGRGKSVQLPSSLETLELGWTTNDIYRRSKHHIRRRFDRHVWDDPRGSANAPGHSLPSFHMPQLQVLSLFNVPIARDMFSHILDLETLQSLTIRDCSRWMQAMGHAVDKGAARFALQTLELKSSGDSWIGNDDSEERRKWLEFLGLIDHVDELYISIEVTSATVISDFWRPLDRLGDTASTYVLHYRENTRADWLEDPLDVNDLGMTNGRNRLLFRPFVYSCVERLGICCSPSLLKKMLRPFSCKETLTLLHVRQTSRDLDEVGSWGLRTHLPPWYCTSRVSSFELLDRTFFEFAQWAFGPRGILSLEVLVFGDFGCSEALQDNNCVLFRCHRSKPGFRLAGLDDQEAILVVDENRRLLGACPVVPHMPGAAELMRERNGLGTALYVSGALPAAADAATMDLDHDDGQLEIEASWGSDGESGRGETEPDDGESDHEPEGDDPEESEFAVATKDSVGYK